MSEMHLTLAKRIADLFAERHEVEAVALSGSSMGTHIDAASDIDLYIYTHVEIPLAARAQVLERAGGASRASLGLNFWGPGDEWFDAATGIEVDIVYFDVRWMRDQVRRVMLAHQASLGYSTCFPFTVRNSQVFYDPHGWFASLQGLCRHPYPEKLRENIIRHNHPVLREIIPSYYSQLKKALQRGDLVSVNHRLTGLLASYFDIIFAFNRQLHPGEKRLVEKAVASCERLPANMEFEVGAVLAASGAQELALLDQVTALLDHLDQFLLPIYP